MSNQGDVHAVWVSPDQCDCTCDSMPSADVSKKIAGQQANVQQTAAAIVTCLGGIHTEVLVEAKDIGPGSNQLVIAAALPRISHRAADQLARILYQHVALCMRPFRERAPAVDGALPCITSSPSDSSLSVQLQ